MIDGVFFDENWKTNYQFAQDRSGSIILGNTAAEGSVESCVLGAAPKPASPPLTSALVTALQSLTTKEKLTPLLDAYALLDSTLLKDVRKNLLLLIEDMMWNPPPHPRNSLHPHLPRLPIHIHTTKPFLRPLPWNPQPRPQSRIPARRSRDFEGLKKDGELADAIKGYWISFAHGEKVWMRGRCGSLEPMGVGVRGVLEGEEGEVDGF
jgi:hypothetical protein